MRDQKTAHGHVRRRDVFRFQIKAAHVRVVQDAAIKYVQPDRARRLRLVRGGRGALPAALRLASK